MNKKFKLAWRIYKYLVLLWTIAYPIYALIDDWNLMQDREGSMEDWYIFILVWGVYFVLYLVVFSIFYWAATYIIVLIVSRLALKDYMIRNKNR